MSKERKSITVDSEVVRWVEKQATKEGRSFSNMIEQMAKKYLGFKNVISKK